MISNLFLLAMFVFIGYAVYSLIKPATFYKIMGGRARQVPAFLLMAFISMLATAVTYDIETKGQVETQQDGIVVQDTVAASEDAPEPSPEVTPPPSIAIETHTPTATPTPTAKANKVTEVVDGDTIKVDRDGKIETVRLIGIDTPETKDPRKPVQCFGAEATQKTKDLLLHKSVVLEFDQTQGERDKYDRLLRYIFLLDGTNVNKTLISEGYAFEYTYNTPYKYQAEFKAAQKDAETNHRGLWSPQTCSGKATVSSPTATAAPKTPPATNSGFTCGTKKYCGEMTSCAEAKFYLNSCGLSRLDGDNDGTPCESLCQ